MLYRTEGIVLKTSLFHEADLIVTYLTKDHGLLKVFAKSPRKIKSRFGSSLEPLTHSRISFWGKQDSALPRLTQADIIHSFESLKSSLRSFLKVSEFIELTINFLAERDVNLKAYNLFMSTLRSLEKDHSTGLIALFYKIKFLGIMGFLPKLDSCGRCGKEGETFYISHGTILCKICSGGAKSSFRLSKGAMKFYAHLLTWELQYIGRLRPAEAIVAEISVLIDEHMKYILQKTFRTSAFTFPDVLNNRTIQL